MDYDLEFHADLLRAMVAARAYLLGLEQELGVRLPLASLLERTTAAALALAATNPPFRKESGPICLMARAST
jgi:hypothetical protein